MQSEIMRVRQNPSPETPIDVLELTDTELAFVVGGQAPPIPGLPAPPVDLATILGAILRKPSPGAA